MDNYSLTIAKDKQIYRVEIQPELARKLRLESSYQRPSFSELVTLLVDLTMKNEDLLDNVGGIEDSNIPGKEQEALRGLHRLVYGYHAAKICINEQSKRALELLRPVPHGETWPQS